MANKTNTNRYFDQNGGELPKLAGMDIIDAAHELALLAGENEWDWEADDACDAMLTLCGVTMVGPDGEAVGGAISERATFNFYGTKPGRMGFHPSERMSENELITAATWPEVYAAAKQRATDLLDLWPEQPEVKYHEVGFPKENLYVYREEATR